MDDYEALNRTSLFDCFMEIVNSPSNHSCVQKAGPQKPGGGARGLGGL